MEEQRKKRVGDPGFGVDEEYIEPEPEKVLTKGPNDEDWKRYLDPARVRRGDPIHRVGRKAETEMKKRGRPRK